jgi:hypothetical protein
MGERACATDGRGVGADRAYVQRPDIADLSERDDLAGFWVVFDLDPYDRVPDDVPDRFFAVAGRELLRVQDDGHGCRLLPATH